MDTNNNFDDTQVYRTRLGAVTLDYLTRLENGESVNLTDYQTRYPELADDLAANLAYYHLEGRETLVRLEQDRTTPGYAARLEARQATNPNFTAKRDALFDQLFASSGATSAAPTSVASLIEVAEGQDLSVTELADRLDLSLDLVMALEQHLVKISGLPRRLVNRLAEVLTLNLDAVLTYLRQPASSAAFHLNQSVPQEAQTQDFATLVNQSMQLTPAQKKEWLAQAKQDAYED